MPRKAFIQAFLARVGEPRNPRYLHMSQQLNEGVRFLDLARPTQYGPRGFGGGGSAAILLEALLGRGALS
jgi:hypothetical protein